MSYVPEGRQCPLSKSNTFEHSLSSGLYFLQEDHMSRSLSIYVSWNTSVVSRLHSKSNILLVVYTATYRLHLGSTMDNLPTSFTNFLMSKSTSTLLKQIFFCWL